MKFRVLTTGVCWLLLAASAYAPPINLPLHISPQNQSAMSDRQRDGGQPLAAVPWGSQPEIDLSAFGAAAVADGVALTGDRPIIRRCNIHHWRGAGIRNTKFDGVIDSVDSHDNYIGAVLSSSDYSIANSQLYNCRDACLWVSGGDFANCRSTNNHYYGGRIAVYNSGSRFFRSVNDVIADSYIGFYGGINGAGANSCTITNGLFQHNLVRDCVFRASTMHLVNCIVAVQKAVTGVAGLTTIPDDGSNVLTRLITGTGNKKVGIELGDYCTIRGGQILLDTFVNTDAGNTASGAPCEAIWIVDQSNGVVIDTFLQDAQLIDGAVGIRLKGAHQNVKIDVITNGWHGSNSRIIVVDQAANCKGLDITIRVNGVTSKTINDYIDIGTGWSGLPIRMINGTTGAETEIAPGAAGFIFRHPWQDQATVVYQLAA